MRSVAAASSRTRILLPLLLLLLLLLLLPSDAHWECLEPGVDVTCGNHGRCEVKSVAEAEATGRAAHCVCEHGYTGMFCTLCSSHQHYFNRKHWVCVPRPYPANHYFVILFVISFASVAVCAAICALWCRRKCCCAFATGQIPVMSQAVVSRQVTV